MRKRFKTATFIRTAVCLLLAFIMLSPLDSDAARRKRRKNATTAVTTKNKSKTKKTSTRRSSTRPAISVTEKTREVAISASQKSTTVASTDNKSKKKTTQNGLKKITVDKPDLEEIRQITLNPDPKNKFYFPKLMARYQHNDTVMTPEEYRYLYLGYMFQEDYDPYRTSPFSDMTDAFRAKEKLSKAETDSVKKYAELALKDNPFDLRQMSFLVHVLKEKRKDMSAKIWEYRLENLLGAIKSTGTGEDEENAWYVIYPMHEYDIVQLLGYEAVDIDYIEPGYDKLIVEPDGTIKHRSPVKAFFFNVQVPQQQYELKHPEDLEEDETPDVVVEEGVSIIEDDGEGITSEEEE